MKFNDVLQRRYSGRVRQFLAVLLAGIAIMGCSRPLRILVGTYTENTTAEGVYLYSYNPKTANTRRI